MLKIKEFYNKYFNNKYVLIIFLIMLIQSITYIYNPEGHDYNVYYNEAINREGGLFIKIIIDLFVFFFGFNGLYILSFIAALLLGLGFMKKAHYKMKYVIPILLFMNPSFKYMSSGVLQNFIAFGLWIFLDSNILFIILPFIHLPTSIYYLIYRGFDKIEMSMILITSVFILNLFYPSNLFRTIQSLSTVNYKLLYFWDYGLWNKYTVLISFIFIPAVYDYLFYRNKEVAKWSIILLFTWCYLWYFPVMIRLVYISFFPFTNILINLKYDQFNRIFMYFYIFYFLIVYPIGGYLV